PDSAGLGFLADVDGRAPRVATVSLHRVTAVPPPAWLDLPTALAGRGTAADPAPVYEGLSRGGVQHGPDFAVLTDVQLSGAAVPGRSALPAGRPAAAGAFRVHPVLLDACLQTVAAHPGLCGRNVTFLPLRIGMLRRYADPTRAVWCEARVHRIDADGARADV